MVLNLLTKYWYFTYNKLCLRSEVDFMCNCGRCNCGNSRGCGYNNNCGYNNCGFGGGYNNCGFGSGFGCGNNIWILIWLSFLCGGFC